MPALTFHRPALFVIVIVIVFVIVIVIVVVIVIFINSQSMLASKESLSCMIGHSIMRYY